MNDDLTLRLQWARERWQQRNSLRAKLDEAGRLLAEVWSAVITCRQRLKEAREQHAEQDMRRREIIETL